MIDFWLIVEGETEINIQPHVFRGEHLLDVFMNDDVNYVRANITPEQAMELRDFIDQWLDKITKKDDGNA